VRGRVFDRKGHVRKISVALAGALVAGLSVPATAAEYSDYCDPHPHKSYCWARHWHARRAHEQMNGQDADDLAACDLSGDVELSIKACTRLIAKNPQDDVTYFNRAIGHDDKKDYDSAISDYSKAIEINPSAIALGNRGFVYTHKRDNDHSFADYARAEAFDAGHAETFFHRGNAYDDVREFDRAAIEYGKAIARDSSQADYYRDRGLAYAANGEYDRATADYDKALAIDPNDAQAYDSRGGAYVGTGQYARAIADFTTAIGLYPTHATAYEHRGYARFYQGDFKAAAADLTRSLELKSAAYPVLFLFLARSRVGETAVPELVANVARLTTKAWPYAVVELYLGRQPPDFALAAADQPVNAAKPSSTSANGTCCGTTSDRQPPPCALLRRTARRPDSNMMEQSPS
jgi:tetratricopeptide (TPR) repeat protein